jgi:hypothetical protein
MIILYYLRVIAWGYMIRWISVLNFSDLFLFEFHVKYLDIVSRYMYFVNIIEQFLAA